MFVILQIGYQKFMLDSEQGLQTIMKVLSKARIIEEDRRFEGGKISTKGMAEIHCEVLPPTWGWCKEKGRADVIEPEIVRPDRLQQPHLPALLEQAMRRRLAPPARKQLRPPARLQLGGAA